MLELLLGILILLIGGLDGVIDAFIGASGGMLNVPFLSLIGVPIKAAIGTSLAVDVVGDCVVAYTYNEHENVDGKMGLSLMIGTVIGAQIGSAVGSALPSFGLEVAYAIFLIVGGIYFWRKKKVKALAVHKGLSFSSSKISTVVTILIGLAVGSVVVLFGGGGGGMILMVLLFVFGFPMHKAVGTSVMVEAGSSLSGCLGYAIRGHINILYGIILMVGIIIGGRLAAKYANTVNEESFSKLVGVIFVVLGVLMVLFRQH